MSTEQQAREALTDSIVGDAATIAAYSPDNLPTMNTPQLRSLALNLQLAANGLRAEHTKRLTLQWRTSTQGLAQSDPEGAYGVRAHALEQAHWDDLVAHLTRIGRRDLLDSLSLERVGQGPTVEV